MSKPLPFVPFLVFCTLILSGCATAVKVGTSIGYGAGVITREDKERYDQRAEQVESAVRPITDREEYFVGRAVAATILGQYRLYSNEELTRYVNELGQALALASDRPLTYGGYHFAILDSDEVNALSCPGGIIFITRGMLKRAQNEEELAGILAHEIAHVNHKDGLGAIKQSRWVQVVGALGADATRQLSGGELSQLASLFEGSVGDVVKTLIVNGYGRTQELAADNSAMTFMHRLGYDPHGLMDYLSRLAKEQVGGANKGLFATHPGMSERLSEAEAIIAQNKWQRLDHQVRDQRFSRYRS
jgi:predicted Zn-dependent protease